MRPSPARSQPPATPSSASPSVREGMRISVLDGIFAVQYATLTSGTLLTAFLLALGATSFQIGLVAALPLLAGLLQPAGALLIGRRDGRRRPVCIAFALVDVALWGVSVLAVVALPPVTAVLVVIGVVMLQQAANAFVGIAWTSWMSDLVPPSLRGRFFGQRNFICNALGAVTAVVAGHFVKTAAPGTVPVFLWLIAIGMGLRLVSIFFLSRQPETKADSAPPEPFARQVRRPFADPGFRRFLLFGAAWGFAVQLASPFFTVYMIRSAHVGVDAVMLFAGMSTVANLLGQRFWGPLCDRYGDHQVLRYAALIVVFQPLWWLLTTPAGAGYYLMAVLSITGGFAWSGHLLANGNLMMRLAPENGKTSFFAVQAALSGAFGALGPLVGGLLASQLAHVEGLTTYWLFAGLKALFFGSFVLRLGAWVLLARVPVPVRKPRLRASLLVRDVVRTFNPTQGFSPLLHVFMRNDAATTDAATTDAAATDAAATDAAATDAAATDAAATDAANNDVRPAGHAGDPSRTHPGG